MAATDDVAAPTRPQPTRPAGPASRSSMPGPRRGAAPALRRLDGARPGLPRAARGRARPGAVAATGTDEIAAELAAADDRVRLVANPTGATGAGLNRRVAAAQHDVVVRLDGHALVPDDYVRVAVETLQRTGADNVGGVMAAEGVTDFQRAVAAAMTSPIGVGQASFHVGGEEGPALTVYLGVFRREVLERLGGYDETFLRAQDWELNHRIRESGGVVWFTPAAAPCPTGRGPTCAALARQYRDYGRWRRVVMREHEGTASLRYLAPPAAVVAVTAGTVVGLDRLAAGAARAGGLRRRRAGRVGRGRARAARRGPGPGCPSSSPPCTGPGGSASSPARAGCAAPGR